MQTELSILRVSCTSPRRQIKTWGGIKTGLLHLCTVLLRNVSGLALVKEVKRKVDKAEYSNGEAIFDFGNKSVGLVECLLSEIILVSS